MVFGRRKPKLCLDVSPLSENPSGEEADAVLDVYEETARQLVKAVRFHEIGKGPLAHLKGLVPSGFTMQGADVEEHLSGHPLVCWKTKLFLPDITSEDLSTYLTSGSLRSRPEHRGFMQMPAKCTEMERILTLRGKRNGTVMYSEHRRPRKWQHDESSRMSQLRAAFRTTTHKGQLMVVEAPVTHPLKPLHAPELLPAFSFDNKEREASRDNRVVPKGLFTAYVLEPHRAGTQVVIHVALRVQPGLSLKSPLSESHPLALHLQRMAVFVLGNVDFMESGAWPRCLELIRKRQNRSAEQAVEEADVDEDMKEFLQEMVQAGMSSETHKPPQHEEQPPPAPLQEPPAASEWLDNIVKQQQATDAMQRLDSDWYGVPRIPEPEISFMRLDDFDSGALETELVMDDIGDTSFDQGYERTQDGISSVLSMEGRTSTHTDGEISTTFGVQHSVDSIKEKYGRHRAGSSSTPHQGRNLADVTQDMATFMMENIARLGERGEALGRVENKTEKMENNAQEFYAMATKLKQDMENRPWWQRL